MIAYDTTRWHELFVATAGASAALAGLVFVAVSINIKAILRLKGVPERGLHTVLLLGALIVSVFGLVSQSVDALGGLTWVLAGITGALIGAVINAWVLLVEILR